MMGKRWRAEAGRWRRRREEGDKLQNVWLWGGELSRLKGSDHQQCTAGQRGKRDSEARLRLPGDLGSFICWQNMNRCSDPHDGGGLVVLSRMEVSFIRLDAADCL